MHQIRPPQDDVPGPANRKQKPVSGRVGHKALVPGANVTHTPCAHVEREEGGGAARRSEEQWRARSEEERGARKRGGGARRSEEDRRRRGARKSEERGGARRRGAGGVKFQFGHSTAAKARVKSAHNTVRNAT